MYFPRGKDFAIPPSFRVLATRLECRSHDLYASYPDPLILVFSKGYTYGPCTTIHVCRTFPQHQGTLLFYFLGVGVVFFFFSKVPLNTLSPSACSFNCFSEAV